MYAGALLRFLVSFFALYSGSLGAQLRDGDQEWESIMGKLMQANRFWNFLGYSFLAGQPHDLRRLLGDTPGVTFLVPTDSAFAVLSPPILASMRNNHTFLKQVLAYHILDARTSMARLKTDDIGETYATALPGFRLQKFRSMVPGKVQLGPEGCNSTRQLATIIQSNLFQDSAALVHVLNRVLIPGGLDILAPGH